MFNLICVKWTHSLRHETIGRMWLFDARHFEVATFVRATIQLISNIGVRGSKFLIEEVDVQLHYFQLKSGTVFVVLKIIFPGLKQQGRRVAQFIFSALLNCTKPIIWKCIDALKRNHSVTKILKEQLKGYGKNR